MQVSRAFSCSCVCCNIYLLCHLISLRWAPFVILSLAIFCGEAAKTDKKRVCVIGAGRAGLAAIKTVADRSENFELIAFERNSDVGGLWIYTDRTDFDEHGLPVQTTVYKNLRINLPRSWMVYYDYPDFYDPKDRPYPPHYVFLEYMRNYTDKFNLRKYIQFDTLVTKVVPVPGPGDWKTMTWNVETRNLNTNEESTTICDAVMVCNGHYYKPNIPKIPGIETFPGKVIHSRSYKEPEDFTNQTVVLLGAGVSGKDIARDLNKYAKVIFLSHRHLENPFPPTQQPSNVRVVRGVVAVNGSELILQDKSTIVADSFIYCTGFLYDFPFLDERSGIVVERKNIQPLIRQSINAEHPSMALIGMDDFPFFGATCADQANLLLDLLIGRKKLVQN